VRLLLTPGQASDKAAALALLAGLQAADVVADRGYDGQYLAAAQGGCAHIPTQRDRKAQRTVDPNLDRQRNRIERFFDRLKHFRRVATRYDKLARNCLAAVALASTRLWIRAYKPTTYSRPRRPDSGVS